MFLFFLLNIVLLGIIHFKVGNESRNKFLSLFLLLVICDINVCQETDINFNTISSKEGLSQNSVVSIIQDDEGFMWFGTYSGLNRFDGYNFKVFKHNPNDPKSISNDHVRAICQDTSGILWIGTTKGLNRFFPQSNEFIHFLHDPGDSNSLSNNNVYNVLKDRDGNIWVGTWGGGLNKMERIKGNYADEKQAKYRFVHYSTGKYNFTEKYIADVFEEPDGSIYIAATNLYRLNKKTGEFKVYKSDPANPNSLTNKNLSSICVDSSGFVWLGVWDGGLNRLDPKTDSIMRFYHNPHYRFSLSQNEIMSLYCDSEGAIWVGTWGGGLNRLVSPNFNYALNKPAFLNQYRFFRYYNNKNDLTSISGNSIYSIYEDCMGTIWVGTNLAGVNKFQKSSLKFGHVRRRNISSNDLVNNIIHALHIDERGKLWIGTEGGLNIYDREKGTYQLLQHNPENPSSLSFDYIRSFVEDKQGNVWVGTMKGLNKYNSSTNDFERYFIEPSNPGSTNNLSLHVSDDGIIWIGNFSGGIFRFDPKKETFKVYKNNPEDKNSIADNQIWDIVEDKNGFLWIGTGYGGLCKFDPKTEIFECYQNIPDNTSSLSSDLVRSLCIDHNQDLWLGTSLGLNKLVYDNNGKLVFMRYLMDEEIPDNGINGIVEDSNNQLWLTTSKGIIKFNPETNSYILYGMDDGLQDKEFSDNAIIMDKKTGKIYAGGINGYNGFHPNDIKGNEVPPEVKIIDLKLFNKSVEIGDTVDGKLILEKAIYSLDHIELSYKENVITLEFAALHYKSPKDNQYAFMLEGFEEDWNFVGDQRMATYTNLHPGDYTFRVKACNSDEVWNEEGASIKITITPPYWQTWWFRATSSILIIAFLLAIYYIRIRQIRIRNIYLENMVNARTKEIDDKNKLLVKKTNELNESNLKLSELNSMKDKFFSIIGHDLKNPINGIMGFSDLLNNRVNTISTEKRDKYINYIYKSARKTFDLLENLLQWARSQDGLLQYKPHEENIIHLIKENIHLNKEFASEKNIEIEFYYLIDNCIVLCDRRMINTVLRNLIVNAIKFTKAGNRIIISVSDDEIDGFIVTSIIDQGIGLEEDQIENLFSGNKTIISKGTSGEVGTGIGLSLCKEFVEMNKGEIWVKSKPETGSTFSFSLPLKNIAHTVL